MNRTLLRVMLVSLLCALLAAPAAWARNRKTITVRRGHPAGDIGRLTAAVSAPTATTNIVVLRFGLGLSQSYVFRLDLSGLRLSGSHSQELSSTKTGAR